MKRIVYFPLEQKFSVWENNTLLKEWFETREEAQNWINSLPIFKNELLDNFAKELLKNGFRLLVPVVKPSTYFHFEKDGKIGYCQENYFGGLMFSTVNKPSKEIGTGFGLQDQFDGIFEPTIKDAEKAFCLAPHWASYEQRKAVKKYKSLEDYISSPINRIIESQILEPFNQ